MYTSFYHLLDKPFSPQPDPQYLWLGPDQAKALSALHRGILENKGFILLTGDAGTGKTTLVGGLTGSFSGNIEWAVLDDPGVDRLDFYNGVARGFGLEGEFTSKVQFLLRFNAFLHKAHDDLRKVVLLVDDCHRLSQDILEELRLLANVEKDGTRLIAVVFIGRREFLNTLMQPNNRAVGGRLSLKVELPPLSREDTADYIRHRLQRAGTAEELFTAEAIERIHQAARGIPRLINAICERALIAGEAGGRDVLDRKIVEGCLVRLNLSRPTPEAAPPRGGGFLQRLLDRIGELLPRGATNVQPHIVPHKRGRWILYGLGALLIGGAAISYTFLPEEDRKAAPETETTAVRRPAQKQELPAFGSSGDGTIDKLEPIGDAIDLNIVADRKEPPARKEKAEPPSREWTAPAGTGEEMSVPPGPESTQTAETSVGPAPESAMPEDTASTPERQASVEPVPQPENSGAEAGVEPEEKGAGAAAPEPAVQQIEADKKKKLAEKPAKEQATLPPLEPAKIVLPLQPNSLELTGEAAKEYREFVDKLKNYPKAKLLVKGFVSARTNSPENIRLSEERARGVEKLLVESGIEPERIEVRGMGNQEPIASNETREGRTRNRRVEVEVVDDGR